MMSGGFIFYRFGNSSNNIITLLRLNTNGTLDADFGNIGIILTSAAYFACITTSLIHFLDGSLLLGGQYYNGSNYDLLITKIRPCIFETLNSINFTQNYPNALLPNPQSGNTITAINIINSTVNVTNEAVKGKVLNPGFKVNNNAVFTAEIKECNY
jgi:hypothetical protein